MLNKSRTGGLVIILMLVLSQGIWASEMSVLWSNIYTEAEDLDQKFTVMGRLIQENDRDLIPTLIKAQADLLLTSRDNMTNQERFFHRNLQTMIVRELGELKAAEAGEILYRTLTESNETFLKAEVIAAIGQVGAVEYAEPLALMLRNLNLGILTLPTREETETLVTSLVTALERLKDPRGFEPVFFVAVGRNTPKIQAAAERSLYNMVEDPSPQLGQILRSSDDFLVKIRALEFSSSSRGSDAGKRDVARIALSEGLRYSPENIREMTQLGQLRTSAARLLAGLGFDDDATVADLVKMLDLARTETRDINEVIACLQALGSGQSDEAARALAGHLAKLNDLQKSGITDLTDQREIVQVIRSLGETGNVLGRAALINVEFSNWNSAVNREARAALAKIQ